MEEKKDCIAVRINGKPATHYVASHRAPEEQMTIFETAASSPTNESEDESIDWIQPDVNIPMKTSPTSFQKRPFTGIGRIVERRHLWFSTLSAIAVGIFFGFCLLFLFSSSTTNESPTQQTENKPPVASAPLQNKQSTSAAFTYKGYVVQTGVFNDEASAEATKASLDAKGIPVYQVKENGQYVLYSHLTTTEEAAKEWRASFPDTDMYVKSIERVSDAPERLKMAASLLNAVQSGETLSTIQRNAEKTLASSSSRENITDLVTSVQQASSEEDITSISIETILSVK
ncbi:SPOR domain-containing protein [Aureibacillus halotolerans]|uniref:Sporulation related protein n=1 Tax=Aureibacillus halotolerans TaxID=1508390 RepID=A0A4V3D4Y7_9BACI|nr:SPOR domain-containing protein [Aureibacillus halotolerans]TDQ37957.1 sporulation related protein [Aureibacillus halotolerans]